MDHKKTKKKILAALLAALTCIATMIIRIPSPTGGYIHLGDGFVLICGILLGPLAGALAAGVGSMLADLLSGYPQYAAATFIIKACAALAGGFIYSALPVRKAGRFRVSLPKLAASGVCGGLIVTGGYLLFETLLLGNGFAAAVTGIPSNLVQNLFGILVCGFVLPVLTKTSYVQELLPDAK